METSLLVHKSDFFKPLVEKYSIDQSGNITYLMIPDHPGIVALSVKPARDGGYRHTFHDCSEETFKAYMMLNTTTVSLTTLHRYCSGCMHVQMLLANDKSCILEVNIENGMPSTFYKVSGNRVLCPGRRYEPLGENHPVREVLPNAVRFERYQDSLVPSVSKMGVDALYSCLPYKEKRIFNSMWRYGKMGFTDEQILPVALLIAASKDPDNTFAMIPGCTIYGEDEELFRGSMRYAKFEYYALVAPRVRSRLVIDQDTFLDVLRKHPYCRTARGIFENVAKREERLATYSV